MSTSRQLLSLWDLPHAPIMRVGPIVSISGKGKTVTNIIVESNDKGLNIIDNL